jgi:hypothetical protein
MVVSISGSLARPSKEGDGVRGAIVSSRAGLLGEWKALGGKVETNVARHAVNKGETLDFVVDCIGTDAFDSFSWAPTIVSANGQGDWRADRDFHGPPPPPVNAWEKYAQALLMTNEFAFVD